MKKVLIINQHTNNHGDEAAGVALIRGIQESKVNCDISVLYNWHKELSKDGVIGNNAIKNVNHLSFYKSKFDSLFIRLCVYLPSLALLISSLRKNLRKQVQLIKASDLVINGPGGVNLGPYNDFNYLWRLIITKKLDKKLAIYSISFGPLDNVSSVFKKRSIEVLKYASFLSLRDDKSHAFADSLGIKYHKSIDTAFLSIKDDILLPKQAFKKKKPYVVIVPNQLYQWHPYFKNIDTYKMDDLYKSIIEHFSNNYDLDIVLLPQLYGDQNDFDYMTKLGEVSKKDNLFVIDPSYNSDIQQKIISESEMVIGARYHTIIFSLNNKIPFYALSYEHKMENTLSILGLSKFKIDLISLFKDYNKKSKESINVIDEVFNNRNEIKAKVEEASAKSNDIAKNTFDTFEKTFLS